MKNTELIGALSSLYHYHRCFTHDGAIKTEGENTPIIGINNDHILLTEKAFDELFLIDKHDVIINMNYSDKYIETSVVKNGLRFTSLIPKQ